MADVRDYLLAEDGPRSQLMDGPLSEAKEELIVRRLEPKPRKRVDAEGLLQLQVMRDIAATYEILFTKDDANERACVLAKLAGEVKECRGAWDSRQQEQEQGEGVFGGSSIEDAGQDA